MAGGTVDEYLGKMTLYAFSTSIITAAIVGFILGHGVNFKMEEDTNTNEHFKFDMEGLTMFINNYFLPALVAMVARFFGYLRAIFGAVYRAVGNRADHQAKRNTQSHGNAMQDVTSVSNDGDVTTRDKHLTKINTQSLETGIHDVGRIANEGDFNMRRDVNGHKYNYTINLGLENDPLSQEVTLLCYWNGRITSGPKGISYKGAMPRTIRVRNKITYNELFEKMYDVTGLNRNQFELQITCRFPVHLEYISVPVDSDDSVVAMLDVAKKKSLCGIVSTKRAITKRRRSTNAHYQSNRITTYFPK